MLIRVIDLPKSDLLYKYSNPLQAQRRAYLYLGKHAVLYKSSNKNKKYCIYDKNDKLIHFGQLGYEDYTKHLDRQRRKNYLNRSASIMGDWKKNKYSPNNLSREILW